MRFISLSADGVESWPRLGKDEVASRLIARIAALAAGARKRRENGMKVEIRRLPHGQGLDLPFYATSGAAGLDVLAALPAGAKLVLEPGARDIVPTGFALSLPPGFEGQMRPRSGLALEHGVTILNAPGTIDSDYRGEVKAILVNLGPRPFEILARHAHRSACDCACGARRARRERGAYGNGARRGRLRLDGSR